MRNFLIALILFISIASQAITGSTFNPIYLNDINTTNSVLNGMSVQGSAAVNSSTNFDWTLADDYLIVGLIIGVQNALAADTIQIQIIDVNNVLGQGANAVVGTPVNQWGAINGSSEINLIAPKKIPAGFKIRVIYTSTAGILGTAPSLTVNFKSLKVLI